MNGFAAAFSVEFLKARRSKVPLGVAIGLSLGPLVSGIFMLILKDPERARQLGVIGAKAELTAGTADWPTFTMMFEQAVTIGGGILFAFLFAWIFGREWADRTMRDLVANPTSRSSIVLAKIAVGALLSVAIVAWVLGFALAIGLSIDGLVGLPGWSAGAVARGIGGAAAAAFMVIVLQTFTAFFAGTGRGYIAALGWAVLSFALAQIFAVLGWGAWFPWSVPALVSGAAGPNADPVTPVGVAIVAVTALAGLALTLVWWERADQTG